MSDAASPSRVPLLKTVTLTYSKEEDRIRLDGADIEGKTQTLWLTARLLNRLVPHLTARQGETQRLLASPQATRTQKALHSDLLNFPIEETRAVQCAPGSPEALVRSVDLIPQESQVMLVFKDNAGLRCAALAMPHEVLKQWKCGLRQCFERAGWPRHAFQSQGQVAELAGRGATTIH